MLAPLPAYTTRRFMGLIILALLAGVLVVGGTQSTVRYFFPVAPQPDFSIVCCWPLNDGSLTVSSATAYNSSYSSWVTLSSLNDFAGTIRLSANLPFPVSFNPSLLSLTRGGRIQSGMIVSVPRGTPLGVYTGTLDARSGVLVRSVTVNLNVVSPSPDFTIAASVESVGIPAGSSTSVSLQLRSLNGFTGTVNLATSIVPLGISASVNPASITLVPGAEAASTISLGPMPSQIPSGGFSVTVNATGGGPTHSVTIHVFMGQTGADFNIRCCWPSFNGNISIASGSTYTSSAKLDGLNNFTGTISLSVNLGLPASIYPSMFVFPTGGQVTAESEPAITISVPANTSPGLYIGNVAGTSGSLVHYSVLAVRVSPAQQDFGMSSSRALLTVRAGSSNSSSIGLWSLNGFAGTIVLSSFITPMATLGSNVTMKPTSLTLTLNGAASSILSVSATGVAQSGNYTVLITASYQSSPSGPLVSHSVAVEVIIVANPLVMAASPTIGNGPVAGLPSPVQPSILLGTYTGATPLGAYSKEGPFIGQVR